jgi:hypothetical protein
MLPFGSGELSMDWRRSIYHRYATECMKLARKSEVPKDRLALLQMALIWSHLAGYATEAANLFGPEVDSEFRA